ncbi:hypothetical protein A2U01_0086827, partial [Trifolium medium]|nr:hypothetical protein [Trifolium medium]
VTMRNAAATMTTIAIRGGLKFTDDDDEAEEEDFDINGDGE